VTTQSFPKITLHCCKKKQKTFIVAKHKKQMCSNILYKTNIKKFIPLNTLITVSNYLPDEKGSFTI
jgi:hypothetical protein